ncbi:MAG: universal stress protein [Desulfohalobiaceae bacterium]|nr:universal stress protein [Desulfohalobiaceae bacterium]
MTTESIRKLLFVTQFEDLRFDTLQLFLELRRASLEHIVFLYVIQRDKVAFQRGVGYKKTEEIKLREKANIRFIDWAENLFEQGMEVGVYIVVGSVVSQVLSAVDKEGIDLTVIGNSEKNRLRQLVSGSDIAELIHRTPVPVLVINFPSEDKRLTENPFHRPLVALNWLPGEQRILDYLISLKEIVTKVDVIHVAREQDLKGESAMGVQKTRKEQRKRLETVCEQLEAAAISAQAHVYVGESGKEIQRAARDCQSSLIVTGIPQKRIFEGTLRKSVPVELAETALCPVLLVPGSSVADKAS